MPTRSNCLACHAKAGGGDNVKHGDLNTDLKSPLREMDVHMDALGPDYSCQACHTPMNHKVPGVSVPGDGAGRVLCTKCHSDAPHESATYTAHTARIACQTCHVPVIGRSMPTKIDWDLALVGGPAYTWQVYTGAFEFVKTEMYLAVNHGVAPKAEALTCSNGHFECPNIDGAALGYDSDLIMGGH